jgi:Uma2 family endonuclease
MLAERTISLEEYLELEKTATERHEFVDGQMLLMAGEKRRHNRVAGRVYALLLEQVAMQGCEIAIETVKIRTKGAKVRYPDVVVSCVPGEDEYLLENPCFVVEVLSPSTAETDLREKLGEYTSIPSLTRYLILAQDQKFALLYRRNRQKWEIETLNGEGEIDIPCLETTLTLEQIYAGLLTE